MKYFLPLLLLLSLLVPDCSQVLIVPSHILTGSKILASSHKNVTSETFIFTFGQPFRNTSRMMSYGIDQFQTYTLYSSVFQTYLLFFNQTGFALSVQTLSTLTMVNLAIKYLVAQQEPCLYNDYYYSFIPPDHAFVNQTGLRTSQFQVSAPTPFFHSKQVIILPFIQGFIFNSTAHILRISPTPNKTYINQYYYLQGFEVTTQADCSVSYFSFNILFINAQEMKKQGYFVRGGNHLIYNQNSGVQSFAAFVQEEGSTRLLLGVNGFDTAESRNIFWSVSASADPKGMHLTFQKQGLNKIYFSYLEIGKYPNISPKGNNLQQQKESDNKYTPYFITIILMIIVSTAIIIMVQVKIQKRLMKISDIQQNKDINYNFDAKSDMKKDQATQGDINHDRD